MVWKIDEILDLENRTSLKLTTMSMKEIKTILDRIEGDSVSNDIERMRNIIFFSKYRLTKTHIEKLI
jgi:ribosomal protein L22